MKIKDALEKYKSTNGEFFSLKKDMDTAQVRFLYDANDVETLETDDLDAYAVHEVEINGKKRYIKCLENGICPLCESGNKAKLRIFIQLIDLRDKKRKIWERTPKYLTKLLGYINKYGALCNRVYEIERHGKPGDQSTTYEFYALDKDNVKLEELPEQRQELLGTYILTYTSEQMTEFLNGNVPTTNTQQPQAPIQRRQASNEDVF